jgi:DNA-binding HxlR family transcriptional regulator
MKKKRTASTADCGVAQALDVVGDGWSMLILRDVFWGNKRFDTLQKSLGIASNVLTVRLRRLEEEGILERHEFREAPPRVEYELTKKGRELYPVLLSLKWWGDRWRPHPERRPYRFIHEACGREIVPKIVCDHCKAEIAAESVRREPIRLRA